MESNPGPLTPLTRILSYGNLYLRVFVRFLPIIQANSSIKAMSLNDFAWLSLNISKNLQNLSKKAMYFKIRIGKGVKIRPTG